MGQDQMTLLSTSDKHPSRPDDPPGTDLLARVRSQFEGVLQLGRRVSLIMGARLVGASVGLISQVLLARLLGAEALGHVYLALSLAAVLAVICGLGLPSVTSRFIAQHGARRDLAGLAAFIRGSRLSTALAAFVTVTLCGLVVLVWPADEHGGRLVLALGLATVPAFLALRLNGAIANGYRRFGTSYLPDLLGRPVLLLIAAGIIATGLTYNCAYTALSLHLAGISLLAFWQYRAVNRILDDEKSRMQPAEEPESPPKRRWLHHAMPMVPLALFTSMFADLAILFAGPFLAPDALATFGVCLKLALLIGFAVQVLHQITLPDAADAYVGEQHGLLRRLITRANGLGMMVCLASTIGVTVLGQWILGLFGPEFLAGHLCLVILSLSQLVRASLGPASHILALAGQERSTIPVSIVSMAALGVLNAVLIPTFGLVGAALSVLLTTLIWAGWLAALSHRRAGVVTILLPALGRA